MISATSANTVVIPAQQLNIAVFDQLWLIENNVVHRDEFVTEAPPVFIPVMMNVHTPLMDVLALSERVQFASLNFAVGHQQQVWDRVQIFLNAALVPVSSIGFNWGFELRANLGGESVESFARRLFLSPANPLAADFEAADSRVGFIMEKAVDDGRLRIDVQHLISSPSESALQCALNFHFEVNGSLKSALDKLNRAQYLLRDAEAFASRLDAAFI